MPRSSVAVAAVLSFALIACPAKKAPLHPAPRATPPARGGTLHVVLADDVGSLDPSRAARPSAWFFARAMYRGLLAFPDAPAPEGYTPAPDLAEALPVVSADGLMYTFHLRSGVRFGAPASRPIVAADAAASIARARATGIGIARFLDSIATMSAPDDRTLVISLSRVTPDLPWILAQPQAAVLPGGTPAPGLVVPQDLSPSGPYRLDSYEPERSLALARNDAWDAATDPIRGGYVDKITASIGVAPSDAFARTVSGAADLVLDTGAPDLRAGNTQFPPDARAMRSGDGCVRYLFLNTSQPPFGTQAVRLAVAGAMVRSRFVGAAPGGTPATRILPPTVIGSKTDPVVPEDLERVKTLLAKAKVPRGFTTTLVVASSPRDRAEAAILRSVLARARITVRLRFVPAASLYPLYYERPAAHVPMGIATWCADWPGLAGRDVLGAIAEAGGYAHLRSAGVARAIDAAASAPATEAATRWAAADAATVGTGAVIPLVWTVEEFSVSARLKGFTAAPMWPHGDPTVMWVR
ncbi:MAG: ABC transporter substrate-binding protein [Actinomycetota bacterium]